MDITHLWGRLRRRAQALGGPRALLLGWGGRVLAATAALVLAMPLAHASFENGGFEQGDLSSWTVKSYTRGKNAPLAANSTVQDTNNTAVISPFPPTKFADLKLLLDKNLGSSAFDGNAFTGGAVGPGGFNNRAVIESGAINSITGQNAPNLKLPRWGGKALRIGGVGGRKASSIEQTATMNVADIDPIDNKIHVRFAMAPVMNDPNHSKPNQPFFFVQIFNVTKNKELFYTFNFSNQPGIPWQTSGNYKYTDWQGFDIAPGNGLLDVGDQIKMIVYVANCSDGGADHTAVVYLDAVGAFMPGLSVHAVGPSSTQPGANITYTYNYINGSGVYALGTKVQITTPFTVDGKPLTFASALPAGCTGPLTHNPASRGQYITCDVGDLSDGQGGSVDVTFKVPNNASTTAPDNVINNGDYNIYANSVSPALGPLVTTTIPALGSGKLVDLGVAIGNGGKTSYPGGSSETYTVTVTNHGTETASGTVSQTITGMGAACSGLTYAAPVTCSDGTGTPVLTFPVTGLTPGNTANYTVVGTPTGASVNTVATVAVTGPDTDSNAANNIAGITTPVGTQHNLTVKADGSGGGHVISTESLLKCGDASTACKTVASGAGVTQPVTANQEVRFTPVPQTGSIFKGWSGCSSTSGNVCIVNNLTADKEVTATFVEAVVVTPLVDTINNNGSIDLGPTQVEKGTTTAPVFTITPGAGKEPQIVPSDTTCTGTLAGPDGSGKYTYTPSTPVSANCQFKVAFVGKTPDVYTQIDMPATVDPSTQVSTLLTFGNQGKGVAQGVSYEVTGLPTGLGGVSCTGAACSYNAATGKVTITGLPTTLAAGQTQHVQMDWTTPATNPASYTLTSTIKTTSIDETGPGPNTASKTVAVPNNIVEVTTTVQMPTTVEAGQTVAGKVTYLNVGSTAGAVTDYKIALAGGTNLVVVYQGQACTITGDVLSGCNLPTSLAPNQSIELDVSYTASTTADDVDKIISTIAATGDTNLANNTATGETKVVAATPPPKPDMSVSLSAPATAAPGTQVNVPVTFTNLGPGKAEDVVYGVQLPPGLPGGVTCTPACSYDPATGKVTVPTGNLPGTLNPGQKATITVSYTAPATGPVNVTARVDAKDEPVPDQGNNVAQAATRILAPGVLSLTKTVYEGHDNGAKCDTAGKLLTIVEKNPTYHDLTWCFVVKNTGSEYLAAPVWNDPELPGLTPMLRAGTTLPLAPGATGVWYIQSAHNRSVVNTVSVEMSVTDGSGALIPGAPKATGSDTIKTTFGMIYDPPYGVKVGTMNGNNVIRWTMVWVNDNVVSANGVTVSDQIQAPMTFLNDGTLACVPEGATTVNPGTCVYNPVTNTVSVTANFGPDYQRTVQTAQNRLFISFNVSVPATGGAQQYTNQGNAGWTPPGGGAPLTAQTTYVQGVSIGPVTPGGPVPAVTGPDVGHPAPGSPPAPPTPVVTAGPPGPAGATAIPVDNPVALLLLALGIAGLMARQQRRSQR